MLIIEKNIAIAEMMGAKLTPIVGFGGFNYRFPEPVMSKYDVSVGLYASALHFDSDWNWLMKAVEWIEQKGYNVDHLRHIVTVSTSFYEETLVEVSAGTRMEAMYSAIYQFSQYLKSI